MTPLRVAIRVDSSARIGSGHLVRCLTLAEVLRARGVEVRFLSRAHAGHLLERVTRAGFALTALPAPPPTASMREDYAEWLGVPAAQDAAESLAALASPVDWLVVDHYGLGRDWQKAMRARAARILVIDDLANRSHDCDLLLDQNYAGTSSARYADLVPATATRLLGPEFALLQPDYARLRGLLPTRDVVRRVLVFFGGADSTRATLKVVEALDAATLRHLALDVVVGVSDPDRAAIESLLRDRAGATVHAALPSLAGLMARADLALGAGGTTTWERACLKLPSLVATIADNQLGASASLARDGFHVLLGRSAEVGVAEWRSAIEALIADPARLRALSARASELTDGGGAERVADRLFTPQLVESVPPRAARPLRVSLLSDAASWLNPYLAPLAHKWRQAGHHVTQVHAVADLPTGDVCFMIGCSQLVNAKMRARHAHNLVVHESALPEGRGWSPMTWQVLEDRRHIVVTLFEAVDAVDAGDIHLQFTVELTGRELIDEWRALQARASAELCSRWLATYPAVLQGARPQSGTPTFYPRRGPADSRLDPDATLARQFDLLRVVDNQRYPAWFEFRGRRYRLAVHAEADPGIPSSRS